MLGKLERHWSASHASMWHRNGRRYWKKLSPRQRAKFLENRILRDGRADIAPPAPAADANPMFDAGDLAAALQENADLRRIVDSDSHNAELRKIVDEQRRELEAKERQYVGAMADRNDLVRANKALQRRLRELSP